MAIEIFATRLFRDFELRKFKFRDFVVLITLTSRFRVTSNLFPWQY